MINSQHGDNIAFDKIVHGVGENFQVSDTHVPVTDGVSHRPLAYLLYNGSYLL